uniref:Uncharacterized protein n=1 Tax=Anguilla anguilla TaxID=7936 RepID=A0A0E9T327_ANGAN
MVRYSHEQNGPPFWQCKQLSNTRWYQSSGFLIFFVAAEHHWKAFSLLGK